MSCSQSSDCENPTEDGALGGSENSALNSLNGGNSHESVEELSDKQMESQETKMEDEERILVDSERENETGDNVSVPVNNNVENDDASSTVSKIEVASNIVIDDSDLAEEECNVDRVDTNELTIFRRPRRNYFNRIYRTQRSDGNSSPDELDDSTRSSSGPTSVTEPRSTENTGPVSGSVGGGNGLGGEWENFSLSSSSSSSSSSSLLSQIDSPDAEMIDEKDITNLPRVFSKPKPRHKWFIVQEVINRQLGVSSRWLGPELFQQRCYGSLHAVQRLELMYKLEAHEGCVNALNFNPSGSLLATASDDRKVALWDWALGKCVFTYDSGHSSNVFQAKFLPLSGDRHIVSCARDGQIRLAVLSCTGVCLSTRQLAVHRRPAHKIATQPETPHVFLSAAEDAVVMSLDVREHNHNKLLICKEGTEKIALYSIHSNPINCHEFCVTGDDHYIRLYDKRKISEGNCLKKFCPQHLVKSEVFIHVTCAVFNYNGTEILGSFNDEDIYLFDTRHSDGADYVHRYEGHRNSVTVKGVNFFGPRSEYIVSGSDCGNIFFWDKHTESIVQWMRGDEEGVVNCLEPHPQVPMIATSGLDHDVKIWVPSCEQEPTFDGLKSAVIFNQKARDENRSRRGDPWDSQMQWLWRQIRRFERRRGNTSEARQETRTPGESDTAPATGASEESSASTEEDEQVGRPECSPS